MKLGRNQRIYLESCVMFNGCNGWRMKGRMFKMAVRESLEKRGLVDPEGMISEAGRKALKESK